MGTTVSLVQHAVRQGDFHQLARLVNSRADIEYVTSDCRDTPLILATKLNHVKCLEILLQAGANLEAIGKYGKTALIRSLEKRHMVCTRMLLAAKAQVNMCNTEFNWTPLQIAADNGYADAVKLLLDANANVNFPDNIKCTALMAAAARDRTECIHILINANATIDTQNYKGKTALHFAAIGGNPMSVRILCQAKAGTEFIDTSGKTALMWADERGNWACVQILVNHRGQPGARVESTQQITASGTMPVVPSVERNNTPAGTTTVTTSVQYQPPLSVPAATVDNHTSPHVIRTTARFFSCSTAAYAIRSCAILSSPTAIRANRTHTSVCSRAASAAHAVGRHPSPDTP